MLTALGPRPADCLMRVGRLLDVSIRIWAEDQGLCHASLNWRRIDFDRIGVGLRLLDRRAASGRPASWRIFTLGDRQLSLALDVRRDRRKSTSERPSAVRSIKLDGRGEADIGLASEQRLAQPGLPATRPAALDIAPADIARVQARTRDGLELRSYRLQGDTICRAARFRTLHAAFGAAFVGKELPDNAANPAGMMVRGKAPHSVFTVDLIDAPGQPTRDAVDEVIAFFRKTLGVWASTASSAATRARRLSTTGCWTAPR